MARFSPDYVFFNIDVIFINLVFLNEFLNYFKFPTGRLCSKFTCAFGMVFNREASVAVSTTL